ncbi:tyrosine-type recombinase/integrase [Escherichia coli]|uniref:tyrosine-type recombinase/integrase n=1 Tax=Escherichia coli TaxID=562 RepID=UPI001C469DD4|nr:site-specific integrase [Escherichia coli]MBW0059752.1 tyrosine-type recombinase/integrase [Escherichia coli]
MALSDTKLRSIYGKIYNGPAEISDSGGLSVRVSPKGIITFQYRYRYNGKPKRMKLGNYGIMTLKEARLAVIECKAMLANGKDPGLAKKQRINETRARATISDIVSDYLNKQTTKDIKGYKEITQNLHKHIIKKYGNFIVDDTNARTWEQIFLEITKAGHPVQAGAMLRRMKSIVAMAQRKGIVKDNEIRLLRVDDVGKPPRKIDRYLSSEEVGEFWNFTASDFMSKADMTFFRLLLLTGCRTVELRLAKREHFDLDNRVWTVPAELSKNKKEFKRGISTLSADLLKVMFNCHGFDIVFPAVLSINGKPMDKAVCTRLATRLSNGIGFNAGFTAHDLRRTCRTHLAALGVTAQVAEKMLGHTLGGVLGVYDRYDYVEEQKEAAEQWANYVLSVSGSKPIDLKNCITS